MMLKDDMNKILAGSGLVKKFVFWMLVIIILVSGIITIFVQINLTKTLSEEFRERGLSISRNLASSTVEPLLIEDAVNLHRLVMNIKNTERDVKYVYITDAKGKVAAHTFDGGFPGDLLLISNDAGSRLLDTGEGYVMDFSAPILGGRAGYVHIGLDETYLNEKISRTRDIIILLFLIVGTAGVLMAYIAGSHLTRPIRALVKGAEEIGKGNYGYQIETGSTDETHILSEAFNQMSYNLNISINELRASEKQLLQSDKLATIGQLAAGVAHEINNPLANISLYAQMLLRKKMDESVKDRLVIINDEAERAARIVKGLLEFARQSEPVPSPTDINAEIDKVLSILNPKLKEIRVVADLQPLPAIMADSGQIRQVLMNMVTNSIQAIKTNGEIIIKTAAEKDHVEISISDNGCGIPAENMGKIFDPFFTTKGTEGTGLGLSICYGIIKHHNGSIDVRSESGRTTFTIKLPAL